MKIFIICSKKFYGHVPDVVSILESNGHSISLPNCFDDPATEERYRDLGAEAHSLWKAEMLKQSTDVIESIDAVLVLNFEKNGVPNYIGGATFLEMYDAFRLGKKIYILNDIPTGILEDEITGFGPVVLKGEVGGIV